MAEMSKPRPEFRNIHVSQIRTYRLPAAGLVSIAHRITGAVLFLMLPFLVWLFGESGLVCRQAAAAKPIKFIASHQTDTAATNPCNPSIGKP